jgi:MFS family permease
MDPPTGDDTSEKKTDTCNPRPASLYKSRHIDLQSRIDELKEANLFGDGESEYTTPSPPQCPRTKHDSGYGSGMDYRSYVARGVCDDSVTDTDIVPPPPAQLSAPSVEMSTAREVLFVGVCAASHFMTQAGLGQTLVPLDIISGTFGHPNPGEQSWFIAAYSLTVGTFIMTSGRLGDIFGHKRVFVFGYAWLGVWSCFAGFSAYPGNQIFFDICRAMQGIGPALLMPNALALFGRAYPPGIRKNIVFSIFGAVAPAGFVGGALFSSLFAQLAWWPLAFWSYGVASMLLGCLALLVIPVQLSDRPAVKPKLDWTGSVLVVTGLVLVNVAFNNGPLYGWGVPHVFFILIIGIMCLVAFAWVEYGATNPLLPVRALNSTVFFVLSLVGLGWGSFGVWVYYTCRFLERMRYVTPLSVSAMYVPAAISGLVAAGMTGFLITHTPVSFVMMISMVAFCGGIIMSCFQTADQTYWSLTFISILVMPFGMDMSFPAATVILSNHMPHEHQGLAASLVNTVVNYSISIALGIAGTVEKNTSNPDDPFQAFRNSYYCAVGLSGMGVVLGIMFFIKTLMTEGWHIAKH